MVRKLKKKYRAQLFLGEDAVNFKVALVLARLENTPDQTMWYFNQVRWSASYFPQLYVRSHWRADVHFASICPPVFFVTATEVHFWCSRKFFVLQRVGGGKCG